MKNKTLWIVIAAVVCLGLSFWAGYLVSKHKYQRNLKEIKSTVESLEVKRDSLLTAIHSLNSQVNSLSDSLKNQKEKIVYIKVNIHEKVDSVRNLPLDDAVTFLSRELSKEASSSR